MTGKDILLKALRSEPVDRIPWLPFVGVHGGSLIGVDAEAYLKNADHIVAGLTEAVDRYRPDGIPVVFDLQLEAEILGCQLAWARETPPSVASHPLGEDYDLESLPTFSTDKGRMPLVLDAVRRAKEAFGDEVALYGLLTGPLTLALHLRGDDVLLDMFDEEEAVPQLLDFCADIGIRMADAFIEAGADVIAVVDPMISQIGPDHFSDWIAPALNKVFDHIREKGALSSLFVCGNATRNLEAMAKTSCDNISVDENVSMPELARVARAAGKSFGGNLQLTVVLLLGDQQDARRDAARCLDEAGEGNGFVLAPGCDLPYSVKPENLSAVAELVRDPYQLEIARKLPPKDTSDTFEDITIPDYDSEKAVIVDVVTLDSAGCAPCAYMVKAAREAGRVFDQPVEIREHKITGRDGLGYMNKLGVSAIPSICVDGKEQFASIIPGRDELVTSLRNAAAGKQ
ncbi:MAG: uroporphyrinogen decarboxylase family protein [Oceanipulchritudo sp.]